MSSYDQWVTASPYDDDPDYVEEAESWLSQHTETYHEDSELAWAKEVIENLLGFIKDEI